MKSIITKGLVASAAVYAGIFLLASCAEDNLKEIDQAAGAAELAQLKEGWADPPHRRRAAGQP